MTGKRGIEAGKGSNLTIFFDPVLWFMFSKGGSKAEVEACPSPEYLQV